jgi:hypothetical protein
MKMKINFLQCIILDTRVLLPIGRQHVVVQFDNYKTQV